jgi:hypothetical protein
MGETLRRLADHHLLVTESHFVLPCCRMDPVVIGL